MFVLNEQARPSPSDAGSLQPAMARTTLVQKTQINRESGAGAKDGDRLDGWKFQASRDHMCLEEDQLHVWTRVINRAHGPNSLDLNFVAKKGHGHCGEGRLEDQGDRIRA